MLDVGCWMLDVGHCECGARSRMLDAGYWILDAGCLKLKIEIYLVLGSLIHDSFKK